jgi:hypothetical protein
MEIRLDGEELAEAISAHISERLNTKVKLVDYPTLELQRTAKNKTKTEYFTIDESSYVIVYVYTEGEAS